MRKQLLKKTEGFTIIEVMIVLAIAGLIMIIVFLAVPTLQRNSRNTARKSEIGRIGSAVSNYSSNNNGSVPASANTSTVLSDAGTLTQYKALAAGSAAVLTNGQFNITSTQVTTAPTATSDAVLVVTGATCNAATPGTTSTAGSSSSAIIYTLETSGGYGVYCQNV